MNDKATTGSLDAKSTDSPEDADKAKSLTELLAEYDDEKPTEVAPKKDEDSDARLARLEALRDDSDMSDLVSRVKGDLDVDDWVVRAWVMNEAANDERMDRLWDSRETKKAALSKIIDESLKPSFKKYAEGKLLPKTEPDKPDPTKKLGAAVRAARSTETKTQGVFGDIDWGTLSDADFAVQKQLVFKAAEAGQLK